MNPAAKLAAFALVLGIALGGGAAVGQAVGPIDSSPVRTDDMDMDQHQPAGATHEEAATDEELPTGVLVSQDGYTLDADATVLDGAPGAPFAFRIAGPDGSVVRDFEERHEQELHLIMVSSDLDTYAHLHPTRSDDGTWTAALPALAPGAYRVFADFAVAAGPELTLGVDVTVDGAAVPAVGGGHG